MNATRPRSFWKMHKFQPNDFIYQIGTNNRSIDVLEWSTRKIHKSVMIIKSSFCEHFSVHFTCEIYVFSPFSFTAKFYLSAKLFYKIFFRIISNGWSEAIKSIVLTKYRVSQYQEVKNEYPLTCVCVRSNVCSAYSYGYLPKAVQWNRIHWRNKRNQVSWKERCVHTEGETTLYETRRESEPEVD